MPRRRASRTTAALLFCASFASLRAAFRFRASSFAFLIWVLLFLLHSTHDIVLGQRRMKRETMLVSWGLAARAAVGKPPGWSGAEWKPSCKRHAVSEASPLGGGIVGILRNEHKTVHSPPQRRA